MTDFKDFKASKWLAFSDSLHSLNLATHGLSLLLDDWYRDKQAID